MSRFVAEIKGSTSMRWTDPNVVAEDVLVPLLKAVYGYTMLRNLNHSEKDQFPGIDLADDKARTAFQVTATTSAAKIKKTLKTFSKQRLYERYSRLIVYILTERQPSYPARTFENLTEGRFSFDPDNDIWDFRNVLKAVKSLPLRQAKVVLATLEENFGEARAAMGSPRNRSRVASEKKRKSALLCAADPRIYVEIAQENRKGLAVSVFTLRNHGGDVAQKVQIQPLSSLNFVATFEPIEMIASHEHCEALPDVVAAGLLQKHDLISVLIKEWDAAGELSFEFSKKMTITYTDFTGHHFETAFDLLLHTVKAVTNRRFPLEPGRSVLEARNFAIRKIE